MTSSLWLLGALVTLCAALLFLFSLREFRAAGTSVQGSEHRDLARSLPFQSQSHIFVIRPTRARIVNLVEWPLAATNARSSGRFHRSVVVPQEERFLERVAQREFVMLAKAETRRV
jgi:hypothetical protein